MASAGQQFEGFEGSKGGNYSTGFGKLMVRCGAGRGSNRCFY